MKKKVGLIVLFFGLPFAVLWATFHFHHRPMLEEKLTVLCADVFHGEPGLEDVRVTFHGTARDAVLVGRVATRADLERAETLLRTELDANRLKYAGVRVLAGSEVEVEEEIRKAAEAAQAVAAAPGSAAPGVEEEDPISLAKPSEGVPPGSHGETKSGDPEQEEPVDVEPPSGPGPSSLEVVAGEESIVLRGRLASAALEKELTSSAQTNQRERRIVTRELFVVPETSEGGWEQEIFLVLNLLLESTLECRLSASGKSFELEGNAENDLTYGALLALCKDLESKEFEVVHQLEIASTEPEEPEVKPAKRVTLESGSGQTEPDTTPGPGTAGSSETPGESPPSPPDAAPSGPDDAFMEELKAATVYFASGSSKLSGAEVERLAKVAQTMRQWPDLKLTLSGFGDGEGDPVINSKMTMKRANAVKSALVEAGLEPERAEAVDKGEGKPVGDRPGRRVELSIKN